MYGCESWTIKKAEHWIEAFGLSCWRKLLRIPWTARRSNQSILKVISPEYSLEGLMLKLKLQYFDHVMWTRTGKDPDAGKDWGQEEKGTREDEMVGWHHQCNGHEVKWSRSVMSKSLWPHGLQPPRLFHPWDFPGKSTGVGCHCLLHIISEVVDISSGNLASSLWFIQPGILRHVFCIDVKEAGWYILDILLSQFGTSQLFYIQF